MPYTQSIRIDAHEGSRIVGILQGIQFPQSSGITPYVISSSFVMNVWGYPIKGYKFGGIDLRFVNIYILYSF